MGRWDPFDPPLFTPPPQFADIMQKIEDYIARQPRAAEGNGGGGGDFGVNSSGFGAVLGSLPAVLFWGRSVGFGAIWGLFRGRFGRRFGVVWGSILGSVLGPFWGRFGVVLWGFWQMSFGVAAGPLPGCFWGVLGNV